MGRIQSSMGLITGIPIEETVNKLMALATQPKTILSNRNQQLQSEKLAIQQLSSLVLAFKFEADKLGSTSLFDSKQATSSDTTALTAAVATGGSPAVGNYLFTPVQTATAQQFLSQSFGATETIGAGSFTFGTGGFVDQGISLNELNGGAGVKRGSIRVTDRSGATAVIDLSFASTVDDVLKAINNNSTINVTAVASGDSFKLTDNTGGSGNLTVQNVGSGTTATDLGLAGISTASATATGNDVFALHNLTKLSSLNDGNGVQLRSGNDLSISLADGTILSVDLAGADTLDDVLEALNAAAPLKFSAAIGADGNRLELTDLTTGSNPFAVTNVSGGTAADDLGLTAGAVSGTITGRRLVAGLRDTLVHSLRGGRGLGTLGEIDITNRNNVSSIVDLSGAETLGQIIDAINSQATGVKASVNSARNGIQLTDATGAVASNLIVADGDAENSATKLGITVNGAVNSVNSGSLGRQQISKAMLLSSLNGGVGIKANDIKFTDSTGAVGAVDLNKVGEEAKTIGDIIDKINALTNVGVEARINDTGDGILLIDTAGGEGKLKVVDVGNGTTAKDLRIAGESVVKTIEGVPKKVIDGTAAATVIIGADDTLSDVVTSINALGRGVTASLLNDGTGQRLSLTVDQTGTASALQIDTMGTTLSFEEISEARDAKVLLGTVSSVGGGILVSSSSNQFTGVVSGLDVTINKESQTPVTVRVATTTAGVSGQVKEFADAYNSLRDFLDQTTNFNEEDQTTGILFGTRAALGVETDLTQLLTTRFFGVGSVDSLEAVGLSLSDKGKLDFDQAKFDAVIAKDPDAIKKLFTDEKLGVVKKMSDVMDRLAGKDSLLSSRTDTLTDIIKSNADRLTVMDGRLARQREALLIQFAQLESTVASLQRNVSALNSLQIIPPMTSSSK